MLFEYVCDCSTAAHCKPVLWHKKIEPRYETVNCGFGLCGFRTVLALLADQFTDLINLPVCYECHLITVTSYNLFIQQWNSQKIRGGYYTILSLIPFNLRVTDHNLSLIKSFPLVLCTNFKCAPTTDTPGISPHPLSWTVYMTKTEWSY